MNFVQEHIAHPNGSFRVLRLAQDGFRGGRHRHHHLELTWIESGAGLRYVGDSVQPFAAGDLVLLGANLPHAWISSPQQTGRVHKATVIQFAPDLLSASALPELAAARSLCEMSAQGLCVGDAARAAVTDAMARVPPTPGLRALAAFFDVLGQLALHQGGMTPIASQAARAVAATHTEQDRRIARVIAWIYANLAQELRVEDAARLVHISPAAFSRYFSREVGKSFTAYINDIRCGEACLQLRATDKPVAVVASECGFGTLSHFNRQFRQRAGMSPREFRARG